jgi:hypothetical protein
VDDTRPSSSSAITVSPECEALTAELSAIRADSTCETDADCAVVSDMDAQDAVCCAIPLAAALADPYLDARARWKDAGCRQRSVFQCNDCAPGVACVESQCVLD